VTEPALNPAAMRIDSFGGTHQGRVRPINEDRFLSRPDHGVFIVADGMGGHSHGDIASSAIVQCVEDGLSNVPHGQKVRALTDSIVRANAMIGEISRANDNIVIGSTIASLAVSTGKFSVLWSGDSRVYLLRDGRIRQLTIDHNEAETLLRQGTITREQAREWPRRNVIVHAIGVNEEPHIEITEGAARRGDIFVLCSDGLTNHLADAEILKIALEHAAQPACVELIRLALARGGTDNVTVVIAKCGG
jgi:serine/threonine protein phosphatase PrpC